MTRLRSHLITFATLLFLALLLIILDQENRITAPQDLGQRIIAPAESGLSAITAGISTGVANVFAAFRDAHRLQAENEVLRRQIEELKLVNVQVVELQRQVERYRELLDFREKNPHYSLLISEIMARESPARVIGHEISNMVRAVRIGIGTESDVEPGMSVITPSGLVGRVQDAGEGWAKVLLLIDESSQVSAVVQQSGATGMVEGTGDGLVMRYIPHEERVEPGDVVLSAGLGEMSNLGIRHPKGLVIGEVESVERSDVHSWQEAVIKPTVDFSQLDYIFVIRSFENRAELNRP